MAFSSLSAQSDRWIMHLWQKGKEDLNGWWWPHSCYHIMSSQFQNRKGGSKSDRGYKKLHAIPKVDNDSLLRLPSSLALTTRWDKVVWNYPIPYFISYPCAIFSGTWARCQYAENQVMFWMVRKECSQLVPSYHDSIPKLSSGVPKSGSPVWREQIPDSVISVYNNK